MNPVTLKELRQLTRSRTISGAIIGYFLLQLVVAALVILSSTDSGVLDTDAGELVFSWLAALLAPLIAFVVPGNLFARLVSEHGPGRAELLTATALRPSAFIDGKIRSGLALVGVFIAGALPFLLLSYLLRGVDMMLILAWTFSVALLSSVAVHLSLFLASVRLPTTVRWCLWAFCAIPCVPFALLSAIGFREEIYTGGWTLWNVVYVIALIASANLLLRGLAIAQLSPRNTDRARPLRLTTTAVWAGLLPMSAVTGLLETPRAVSNCVFAMSMLMACVLAFLAAFDLSSAGGPSRRVLLDRPAGRWRRLLRWPFATGFESGLAFALLLLGANALAGIIVLDFGHADSDQLYEWLAIQISVAYILAAMLAVRALLRVPAIARRVPVGLTALFGLMLIGLSSLIPNLLAINGAVNPSGFPFNISGITVPVDSSHHVHTGNLRLHFLYATVGLGIGVLLHARPLFRSLRRYVGARSPV